MGNERRGTGNVIDNCFIIAEYRFLTLVFSTVYFFYKTPNIHVPTIEPNIVLLVSKEVEKMVTKITRLIMIQLKVANRYTFQQ